MHPTQPDTSQTPEVLAIGPGRWTADIPRPDPIALLGAALTATLRDLGEERVLTVTAHLMAPAPAGPVEITVGRIDRTRAGTTTDARVQHAGLVIARLLLLTPTGR